MGRQLMVEWTCDAASCGKVVYNPANLDDPAPTLPGDWKGTETVVFCPDHADLVHAHRHRISREAARSEEASDG